MRSCQADRCAGWVQRRSSKALCRAVLGVMAAFLASAVGGCAAGPASVVKDSCARYQRLCMFSERAMEAAFEYEYAAANRRLCPPGQAVPEPAVDKLLDAVLRRPDVETLIALAGQESLSRVSLAAHDKLAFVLDRPKGSATADLVKYYRDNAGRLMFIGNKFKLMDGEVFTVGVSVGGSAGSGMRADDPLSIARGSYQRFLALCRERRYREAAIEYQYSRRNFLYFCAAHGYGTSGAGSSDPLMNPLFRDVGSLAEVARYAEDYPDLAPTLRYLLNQHVDKPYLSLPEMVQCYQEHR